MATIKQALAQQIIRTSDEIDQVQKTIAEETAAVERKYEQQIAEKKAAIRAMQSMVALYEKHTKFLDTIAVTPVVDSGKPVAPKI